MELQLAARLLAALALSAALGWERERKHRPAGLRTHMVVGMSATLFVVLGELFVQHFDPMEESLRFDPLRIIEATVGGISFLGAGTIFLSGDRIRGLTTAASLLATAAVGLCVGLERYVLAASATFLLLMVLALLRRFHDDSREATRD